MLCSQLLITENENKTYLAAAEKCGPLQRRQQQRTANESLIKKLLSYVVLTQNSYVAICSIQQ